MAIFDVLLNDGFTLALGGEKRYQSLSLKDFILFLKIRDELFEALKKRDKNLFLEQIKRIYNLQTKENLDITRKSNDILVSLLQILLENRLNLDLVFLKPAPTHEETKPDVWSYPDRIFIQWIDILASRYHWSLNEILNINYKLAFYFIQEALVGKQLDKEFTYSLSELAYRYDSNTKSSKFEPLNRPFWMKEGTFAEMPRKQKIPLHMLPKGIIINISGMETQSGNPIDEQTNNSTVKQPNISSNTDDS